jgi:hypothetical protein
MHFLTQIPSDVEKGVAECTNLFLLPNIPIRLIAVPRIGARTVYWDTAPWADIWKMLTATARTDFSNPSTFWHSEVNWHFSIFGNKTSVKTYTHWLDTAVNRLFVNRAQRT